MSLILNQQLTDFPAAGAMTAFKFPFHPSTYLLGGFKTDIWVFL